MFMCFCNESIVYDIIEKDKFVDEDICHKQQDSLQRQIHDGSFIISKSESLRIKEYVQKNKDTWINE
jgi:hypothetical protein